jgi:hypothetical protein
MLGTPLLGGLPPPQKAPSSLSIRVVENGFILTDGGLQFVFADGPSLAAFIGGWAASKLSGA